MTVLIYRWSCRPKRFITGTNAAIGCELSNSAPIEAASTRFCAKSRGQAQLNLAKNSSTFGTGRG